MRKGIFVSATGTDVGKTYLSALILKGLQELGINAGYFKAALSGAIPSPDGLVPGDAKYVCDIAGLSCPPASLVPYIYETAVSPHLAAQKEGNPLDLQRVKEAFEEASKKFDYLLCEGSG